MCRLADISKYIGLGGGIVDVPAECKASDLNKGVGVTIYHLVKNIEEVCFPKSQLESRLTDK